MNYVLQYPSVKSFILIALYVCLGFTLIAQTNNEDSLVLSKDEITALISNYLIIGSDSLDQKSYNSARELALKARELLKISPSPESTLESLYLIARSSYYLSDFQQSFQACIEGLVQAQELNNKEKQAYFNNMLGILSRRSGDCEQAIAYYTSALEINRAINDSTGISRNYNNLSICYQILGNFNAAFDALENSLSIKVNLNDTLGQANIYLNMGNAYEEISNYEKAFETYLKAKEYYHSIGRTDMVANTLFNIGLVYQELNDIDKALEYYGDASQVADEGGMPELLALLYQNVGNLYSGIGNNEQAIYYQRMALNKFYELEMVYSAAEALLNMGIIFSENGKIDSAEHYYNKALEFAEQSGESNISTDVYIELGKTKTQRNDFSSSEYYLNKAKLLTEKDGDIKARSNVYKSFYELYKKSGRTNLALENYEQYSILKDSINKSEQEQSIAKYTLRYDFQMQEDSIDLLNKDIQLQQADIDNAHSQTKLMRLVTAFLLLGTIGVLYLFNFTRKKNRIISVEKERSEELLKNILPEETAEELKRNGFVKAQRYELATVLFTDFVNFTNYSEDVMPEDVVKSVDYYFKTFDQIFEAHGIEKIKTIGDAYMCAGGLPKQDELHAHNVLKAAKEVLDFVQETSNNPPENVHPFDIRIGVNSGPIVAGVVGIHKFQYDIWGDTVNIASRMESACEPDRINVSESTYELTKDEFDFVYRGEIHMKNKGMMKMYYLNA